MKPMVSLSTTIRLLRTPAFIPDEKEAAPILCTISSQEAMLTDLDKKIVDLKRTLDDLQAQRTVLYNSLAANRGLFSPIRRLLPEILSEIFMHCIPREKGAEILHGGHSPRHQRLSLLHICHRWRDVAQRTPRLWGDVYVHSPKDIPYALLCLCNSGSVPLNIAINHQRLFGVEFGEDVHVRDVPEYSEFATALLKKIPFIQKLDYTGGPLGLNTLFPPGSLKKYRYLERISLETYDTRGSVLELSQLSETPRLHTLKLHTHDLHLISFTNPVVSLRNLVIRSAHDARTLKLLRVCPGLEDLTISFDDVVSDFTAENEDVIFLPALQNLTLKTPHRGGPGNLGLLQFIRPPNLRSASLQATPRASNWQDWNAFLSVVRSSLRHLSFSYISLLSPALHASIKSLTQLETLEIGWDCEDDAMLWRSLTPEENTPPASWACPGLAYLRIFPIDLGAEFIEFVQRRTEPPSQASGDHEGSGRTLDIELEGVSPYRHEYSFDALRLLQLERNELTITGLPPRRPIVIFGSESAEEL